MDAAKHTPGPWRFNDDFGTIEAESGRIADLNGSDFTIKEDERNGALIAAAPALLSAGNSALSFVEACAAQFDLCDNTQRMWSELRAAIAKAEGRSDG